MGAVDYFNPKGRLIEDFNIGNEFDRYKWHKNGQQFQTLLNMPQVEAFWHDILTLMRSKLLLS